MMPGSITEDANEDKDTPSVLSDSDTSTQTATGLSQPGASVDKPFGADFFDLSSSPAGSQGSFGTGFGHDFGSETANTSTEKSAENQQYPSTETQSPTKAAIGSANQETASGHEASDSDHFTRSHDSSPGQQTVEALSTDDLKVNGGGQETSSDSASQSQIHAQTSVDPHPVENSDDSPTGPKYHPLLANFATTSIAIIFSISVALLLIPSNTATTKLSFGLTVMGLVALFFQLMSLFFGAGALGFWISNAYSNLRAFGVTNTKFKTLHYLLAFFVPVVNVIVTYAILQEIWKASSPQDPKDSWKASSPSKLVFSWAVMWLIATQVPSWLMLFADFKTDEASRAFLTDVAWTSGSLLYPIAGILCIIMLKRIGARQEQKNNSKSTDHTETVTTKSAPLPHILIPALGLLSTIPGMVSLIYTTGAYEAMESAKVAYSQGDYDQALKIMKENTHGASYWVTSEQFSIFRARCIFKQGKYQEAINTLSLLLKQDAYLADAWITRGEFYRERGQYLDSISDLSQVIQDTPTNADAHYGRALTYFAMKQPGEAMQDAEKAIELEPAASKNYSLRADILASMEQYAPAIESYNKANQLNQDGYGRHVDSPDVLYSIGLCYERLGDKNNAIAKLKEAERLFTESRQAQKVKLTNEAIKRVTAPAAGVTAKEVQDAGEVSPLPVQDLPEPPDPTK